MRLWSIHPFFLTKKYLGALWSEGHLALSVLSGLTVGYKNHPQLERFKLPNGPMRIKLIQLYLNYVFTTNNVLFKMKFDQSRIQGIWVRNSRTVDQGNVFGLFRSVEIPIGQVLFELWFLSNIKNSGTRKELYSDNQKEYIISLVESIRQCNHSILNPIFKVNVNDVNVAPWEKTFITRPDLKTKFNEYLDELGGASDGKTFSIGDMFTF